MRKSITLSTSATSLVVYSLPSARHLARDWPGAFRPQQCLDSLKRKLAVADPSRLNATDQRMLEACLDQASQLLHAAGQIAERSIVRRAQS